MITRVRRPVSGRKTATKKTTLLACVFAAVVSLAPGVSAITPSALLNVRLPKTPVPAKSISVVAVAVETGQVLAGLTAASASSQVTLTVSAVPQVVFADWLLSDGKRVEIHSTLLRPVAGRMLTVDLSPQPTAGTFPAMVNAAYRLPETFTSFVNVGGKPTLIGLPAIGFTVKGLELTGADVALAVTTEMINGANCYGEDSGFVVVETDPKVLAILKAEIELSNSELADPAYRLTNHYVAPRISVGGSWSSDGTNITVTLRELDSQGKELLKKSATGPLIKFLEINAGVARALAEAMSSCPSASRWSGKVTYSRTTNDHSEKTNSDFPTLKDSETREESSSYQVEITITGGDRFNRLQATAIVSVASHSATGRHIVDSQGCSIHGPPVLKLDTTDSRDFSGSSTQELLGSLSINEDGTYSLSFRSPRDVVAQGNSTYISSSTGWCDPEKEKKANFSRNVPITEQVRFPDSSSGIGIKSRVDPSRLGTLRGTWTPAKQSPKVTTIITWEIQRPVSPERKATPRRQR